jgi:hypothetical protein
MLATLPVRCQASSAVRFSPYGRVPRSGVAANIWLAAGLFAG